jgi:hypothetical protein
MAYTGTAVYSIYANEVGESVSDLVSLIAPVETQLLDSIGDSNGEATSKMHGWEEDAMLPRTYGVSTAIASSAGTSEGLEIGANAGFLRVGDILALNYAGILKEQIYVTSIGASNATIYVTRAYAGTTATSLAATLASGASPLVFLGSAMEEGVGVRKARRVGKVFMKNYVQTFREDIDISNLAQYVVTKAPNQPMPYDEEVSKKTKEVLIQLENAVVMGRTNGNTIGASGTETTMAGIYYSIATNVVSHATYSNSILNETLAKVNAYTDIRGNQSDYHLFAGDKAYRLINNSRTSSLRTTLTEATAGIRPVNMVMTDYGEMPLNYVRSLPTGTVIALRKSMVKVMPYRGNSFATRAYDLGALTKTGYVAGTYTIEFQQETAHGRLDGLSA